MGLRDMMELLNRIKQSPFLLSLGFIVFTAGVVYSFFSSVSSDLPDESIQKTTLNAVEEVEVSPAKMLMAEVKPHVLKKKKKTSIQEVTLPDEQNFYQKFDIAQNELVSNLKSLEKEHQEVLNSYRKNKIYINSKLRFEPRLLIVLSFYLDKEITEITNRDIKELDLKSSDWYLLKTFSESKDFEILLQRKSLNPHHVRIDELKGKYQPRHS